MDSSIKKTMALYPIYMGDVKPHYTLQKAFEKNFDCFTFDWVNISAKKGLPDTQLEFIELLKEKRPEYCFMQLQNPINMSVPIIREMAKYTKIVNWSGDIRQSDAWYRWFEEIGREIHLTTFSNNTDVDIMRERGVRSGYLQVGFDTGWYYKKQKKEGLPEIVFCCNDYGNFQLSKYRVEVVKALKREFGNRFMIYGSGWEKHGIQTKRIGNVEESDVYNNCKVAISVSNFRFKRYYSDRLLRIMGCGAFPLSHDFEEIEKDFTEGQDIVTFKNIKELIQKCHYYLDHDEERNQIAENAYKTAHTKCTWDIRCEELIQLLGKYEHTKSSSGLLVS
jgi:hypothetical protein